MAQLKSVRLSVGVGSSSKIKSSWQHSQFVRLKPGIALFGRSESLVPCYLDSPLFVRTWSLLALASLYSIPVSNAVVSQ